MRKPDVPAAREEAGTEAFPAGQERVADTKQVALKSLAWLMRNAMSESVRVAAHREYLARTWGLPDDAQPEPPVTYYVANTPEALADIEKKLAETGEKATIVTCVFDEEEARRLGIVDPARPGLSG